MAKSDEDGVLRGIGLFFAWFWYFILVAVTWPYDWFNINPMPPNTEKDANKLWD